MVVQVEPEIVYTPKQMVDKAVVLLSGGIDSTTLTYDLLSQGFEVYPVSFNYGQKHNKELVSAVETSKRLGLVSKVLDLGILGEIAPSSLTRRDWEVPKGHYQEESMKQTVVPNRNMVLLSLATAYAIGIKVSSIYYAAHSGDHAIYPDCRRLFVNAMSKAIELCDWDRVELRVPYIDWDKERILRRGLELGVDYSLTWTCYEGKELACGKCGSCVERLEAFGKLGIKDLVRYEEAAGD